MTLKCLVLLALACSAQEFGPLNFGNPLSGLNNYFRDVNDKLTKNPVVDAASKIAGNALTSTNMLSSAITQVLGNNMPVLINEQNIMGSFDSIVQEYNAGLENEDINLPIMQIIRKYGYRAEKHEVTTEDGYVLSLFRIPGNGPVVFVMHGLLESADDFVSTGPEHGLAFLLANEGYDVWMGNARGNKHSRHHIILNPADASFWDFSWHEIGYYDLPAMIDYTLKVTKASKVKYIGHSQGTTSFFIMAAERPEYNNKIAIMVALSPVAFMSNMKSPFIRLLAPGTDTIHTVVNAIGYYEFLPDNIITNSLKLLMCGTGPLAEMFCSNVLFLIAGFGFKHLHVNKLSAIYEHVPAGAAAKQFVHYGQGVVSGEFRQFDHGTTENLKKYGTPDPPRYALEKVVAPVSLFFSDGDWLAHPTDVNKLHSLLGNVTDVYRVPSSQFNHLDFVWAKDIKTFIFARIQKLFSCV